MVILQEYERDIYGMGAVGALMVLYENESFKVEYTRASKFEFKTLEALKDSLYS